MPIEIIKKTLKKVLYDCDVTGDTITPGQVAKQDGNWIVSKEGLEKFPDHLRDHPLFWIIVKSLNSEQHSNMKPRSELLKKVLGNGIYVLVWWNDKTGLIRSHWAMHKDARYEGHNAKRFYDIEECKKWLEHYGQNISINKNLIIFIDGHPTYQGVVSTHIKVKKQ